jgi:SAM-dependent methyltransferase
MRETVTGTFNDIIHAERSRLLKKLPTGAKVVCSAGCSGPWYFTWFEECYGYVPLHIGVELYSPKPTDLPKNVQWIENSVGAMQEIRDDSVDLMFSGQNIEHLSPSDILGFFNEANRVVRDGGLLCIDSPNRSITLAGRYVQPEHVLELSTDEAVRLFELAGFDVLEKYGIWLCQTATGERLPITDFEESSRDERCREAHLNPERSFIWWIVARKVREADMLSLKATIQNLFLKDFPGFVRARHFLGVGAMVAADFQLAKYSTAIEARAFCKGLNAELRFGASILRVG